MNYDFSDEILEKSFDLLDTSFGAPVQADEITASLLYQKDSSVTQRTWLNRLKKGVEEGKFSVRVAKQGELAFRPIDG